MNRLDWTRLLNATRIASSAPRDGDVRTEFERDYDRALFSAPVRRLQDKAQVFPLESNDSIRTRLTHSLEVSSIARALARACAGDIIAAEKLPERAGRDLETICQTCGLLHDVGNPPFGHAGEEAISNWFEGLLGTNEALGPLLNGNDGLGEQRRLDFKRFDGNPQTFRIITRLQLVDGLAGLNLTHATLAALMKYTAPSHKTDRDVARFKKHGYFFAENSVVEQVRAATGLGDARHPLTYLIEAADDIAYAVIDIEDALTKGVIGWDLLKTAEFAALESYRRDAENAVSQFEAGKHYRPAEKQKAYATRLRAALITELVGSVRRAFKKHYQSIMDGSMNCALEERCDKCEVFAACKRIATQYVYFALDTLKLEIMGRNVVSDLLTVFWDGIEKFDPNAKRFHFPNKVCTLMSANYRRVFENGNMLARPGLEGIDYHAALHLVTDQVCGMTDTFAVRLHRELFNG